MKYIITLLFLALATMASSQYLNTYFGSFPSGPAAFPSLPGSLPASSFYSGGDGFNRISSASARDPRANTGPIVFPPSPEGDPNDTSGVIIGASGYGFVPPSHQAPSFPRFTYNGYNSYFLR